MYKQGDMRKAFPYFLSSLLPVCLLAGQFTKAEREKAMDDEAERAATVSATFHECLRGCPRDHFSYHGTLGFASLS